MKDNRNTLVHLSTVNNDVSQEEMRIYYLFPDLLQLSYLMFPGSRVQLTEIKIEDPSIIHSC